MVEMILGILESGNSMTVRTDINRLVVKPFNYVGELYFGIFDLYKGLWVTNWSFSPNEHYRALDRIQEVRDGEYDVDGLVLSTDNPYGPEVYRPWDEPFHYDEEYDDEDDGG